MLTYEIKLHTFVHLDQSSSQTILGRFWFQNYTSTATAATPDVLCKLRDMLDNAIISQERSINRQKNIFKNTVKPPNRGHFGDGPFVPCREVVLFSEVLF